MKKCLLALFLFAFIWGVPAMAEDLTLERIFASPSLSGPTPRGVKLSPDGKWLTSLRPRTDDRERFDLWVLDIAAGTSKMLVDSAKLGSGSDLSEAEKMQRERARIAGSKGIVSYDWSPDSLSLLVPVDGNLFLVSLDGKVRKVAVQPGGQLNPQISPKGGWISFVHDQNLHVQTIEKIELGAMQITPDGRGTVHWGEAEFVAQEEMHRITGYWWSPDDRRIAVARFDEAPVGVVSRAAIGASGTKVYDQRYPVAGSPNALIDLYLMPAGGGDRVKVDLGTNPDIYLARVNWLPDGKALLVQRQSRDQKRLDMLLVDGMTGASRLLFSEASKTWINLHDNLRILKDGSLIWTSERGGYSHLYHYSEGKWNQLTKGPWMVHAVAGVDEAKGLVYFTANRETPVEQQLYAVSIRGGSIRQITQSGAWYGAVMDKSASRAIISRSSQNQPPQVYLADGEGRRLSWIEENAFDSTHPYAAFKASHIAPSFGTIKASDGSVLHTKLMTPKLEAGKRYPVLVQVYGGPGTGRQVTNQWGAAVQQLLVDKGWIVFSVDGRGSPDRGTAFESQIYKAMGGAEVADQLAGVDWLKKQAFVDPKRIAIFGWSYGGYMTLKLLEAAHGTFAAGVAVAPVTKWELYDTHYTERYMGDPRTDGAAYARAGALLDAGKISDPLLLIHGMADDNVVLDNSTALMAKLQQAAVPFETMMYPGQGHGIGGPKISVHLWTSILNFLNREVNN